MAERGSTEVWLADPARLEAGATEAGATEAGATEAGAMEAGAMDEDAFRWLSHEERARVEATVDPRARAERRAAYLLARWALARQLGRDPAEVSLERDGDGRPRPISDPRGTLELSLAHTRGLVVCGVARNARVGVDAERRRPQPRAAAIARRFFCAAETQALDEEPVATRPDRFWALWTLKEAFIKATGADLFDGLGACAFQVGARGDVEHVFARLPLSGAPTGRWAFELFAPSETHYVAIAVGVERGEELPAVSVRDVSAELSAAVAFNRGVGG